MEVILTADVPQLGHMGDVVKVADGYGRNYLIPHGMAVQATKANRRQFEHVKREVARKSAKLRKEALSIQERLEGLSVTLARRTATGDKLYGAVTSRDIANELTIQGHEVDRRQVQLKKPIKELGIYDVPVRLHADVSALTRIWVVRM